MRALALLGLALCARVDAADAADLPDAAGLFEPIDFAAAVKTATDAVARGESLDDAVASAGRVLEGESPFEPLPQADGATVAARWLSAEAAPLLQHEIISTDGWTAPDVSAPRRLVLCAPLPRWADELARKLAPALGEAPPEACTVYACEAGQRVALEPGPGGLAVLSLHTEATLESGAAGAADEALAPLAPRSLLLLSADACARAPRRVLSPTGRHLSIVFPRARKH